MPRLLFLTRTFLTLGALSALLGAPLLLASCKERGPAPPSPVVVAFYSLRIVAQSTGAPTEDQLRQFAPFLSDTLAALLRTASAMREQAIIRSPSEKPPFAEGDLFSSLFEGPTTFLVLRDSAASAQRKVVVRFTYIQNGDSYAWTDTVQLGQKRLGKKRPFDVIEDIAYGGAGEFGNKGTLRRNLELALTAAASSAAPPGAPPSPAGATSPHP